MPKFGSSSSPCFSSVRWTGSGTSAVMSRRAGAGFSVVNSQGAAIGGPSAYVSPQFPFKDKIRCISLRCSCTALCRILFFLYNRLNSPDCKCSSIRQYGTAPPEAVGDFRLK